MNSDNSQDKTIRDNAAEDVKKLIINKEGNGAENDYASETEPVRAKHSVGHTAREINSDHTHIDAMQGTYKESNNPESKDSDNPYEDSMMPEYHNHQPLSEVSKKTENEK